MEVQGQTKENEQATREFYRSLRNIPWKKWSTTDPEQFIDNVPTDSRLEIKSPEQFGPGLVLVARAAHETSEDDFVNCISNGELPPLTLTTDEMELLRAGADPISWLAEVIKEGKEFWNRLWA